MIDLHAHILPCLDDGAPTMEMSIEMARMAVADGTNIMACTPHITPSVYENSTTSIIRSTLALQTELDRLDIPLHLTSGADYHISDTMLARLRDESAPTIGATDYFLFEPSHHVMPPRLVEFARLLKNAGYMPILTHPERLSWIENRYDVICQLHDAGMPMQITAGSITGQFGKRAQYWAEKMLEEDRIDLLASDTHNVSTRPPGLSRAAECVTKRSSHEKAMQLVVTNPVKILRNEPLIEFETNGQSASSRDDNFEEHSRFVSKSTDQLNISVN